MAPGSRVGPVPGYVYMPGEAIRWDTAYRLPDGLGDEWWPLSIETIHAGSRQRIVLSIGHYPMERGQLFTLLKQLTSRIHMRTTVQAVAIEARLRDAGEEHVASLIYSADGQGWTGTADGVEYSCYIPGEPAFRFGSLSGAENGDASDVLLNNPASYRLPGSS